MTGKRDRSSSQAELDRVAAQLATSIISRQIVIAAKLNRGYNSYTLGRKIALLIIVCLAISGLISMELLYPDSFHGTYPQKFCNAAHIGKASGGLKNAEEDTLPTYPLILKNK